MMASITILMRLSVTSPELDRIYSRANCEGMNPDIFDGEDPVNTVLAKAACAKCVVREECLSYALDSNKRTCIWGGHTPEERVQIRQGVRNRDDLSYLFVPATVTETY